MKFDPEAKCCKCGHDKVDACYFSSCKGQYDQRYDYLRHHPKTEHIRRRCERCSFEWFEDVLSKHEAAE